jgi:hypothetical protein
VQLCAAIALVGAIAGAAQGSGGPARNPILGVVRAPSTISIGEITRAPGFACSAPGGTCTPLRYQGGEVMHQSTVYTVFWIPAGYTVD